MSLKMHGIASVGLSASSAASSLLAQSLAVASLLFGAALVSSVWWMLRAEGGVYATV